MGVRFACVAIGYLFGLFQTSYIIGRMHGIDIREHGSGNAGTTNMMRTLGTKAGLLTFFGDCFKCVLAVLFMRLLFGKSHADILPLLTLYTAAGVILGHNFPFYLRFKGGKGIAATAGLGLVLHPVLMTCGIIEFAAVFLLTHYVSLGSLAVYAGIMVGLPVIGQLGLLGMEQPALNEMYLVALFLALLAVYQHRENIRRLIAGTERKTYLSKKKKSQEEVTWQK